ncbi:MAG: efflux RND transporter periplasmic adaptor subunit [Planctomycetes bacterium]|nr:efflux RND transporter periplasmic adaptor subunit [Planctomycetota bacterium]
MTTKPKLESVRQPRKKKWTALVLSVLLIAGVATGAWFRAGRADDGLPETPPMTAEVVEGPFLNEVVERGDIDSSSNVEVRSEVRSRTSVGTTILEIVPEGTRVEPGDFLVRLDDSALQTELIQQQIIVKNSEALMIQAATAVETAILTLQEYESGTYKQSVEELQAAKLVAEENLRRAEEYLLYSERLATKGYVTTIQLDADRFAVQKAQKDLDVAETKLDVVTNFTKEKTVKRYEADIQAAEARLRAAKDSHQIELSSLNKIETQIAKCAINAPVAGQVVYANETGRATEPLIAEGRVVRERQTIVRLPDHEKMQVTAKVNESRVDLIKSGQTVAIHVDALPGVVLTGSVRKVAEYPLPTSVFTGNVKNYQTDIDIHDPPEDLRPGMTAEVNILVEQRELAMQVPIQAIVERGGRHFCLIEDDTTHRLSAREVEISSSNDTQLVVESGLKLGERVVISPNPYLESVQLPDGEDTQEPKMAIHRRAQRSAEDAHVAQKPIEHVVKKPVVEVARGE